MSWRAEPVMLETVFFRWTQTVRSLLRNALDYEELNATQSIRVRVKDEHDASVEGIFLVTVTDLNDPPENLVEVSDLNISENQPVGSPVGKFNAVDQDANATLIYELVNGSGGSDNGLFTLETNGTLDSYAFDFESNASTYFDIGAGKGRTQFFGRWEIFGRPTELERGTLWFDFIKRSA